MNMTTTNTLDRVVYNDDVVRKFTLATVFWGIAGFAVGLLIALQLAFPAFNFEPYLSFGRLRPLHTSAVIRLLRQCSFHVDLLYRTTHLPGTLVA